MEKIFIRLLIVAVMLMINYVAHANPDPKADAIQSYLTSSGEAKRIETFSHSVTSIQTQFSQHLQQQARNPATLQQRLASFTHASQQALKPKMILSSIQQKLEKMMNTSEALANLQWWQSSLGQKIVHAQDSTNSADASNVIRKITAHPEMLNNPSYVQMIKMIIANSGQEELAQYFGFSMIHISDFLSNNTLNDQPVSKKFRQNIDNYVLAVNAYIYRDFSPGELQQYLDYLRSTYGKKATFAYNQAIEQQLSTLVSALSANKS